MNILIVDDNEINRKVLRVSLQAEGLNPVEAADGVEALNVLAREKIDAIISDILMPNMDGYRLCYEVRRNDRFKTIPFIVYTNTYTSVSDERLALEFGADKYIRKPSPTEAVLDALREVTAEINRRTTEHTPPAKELEVMKAYSERLVEKLEERNVELLRQTQELQESEEKFRGVFENIPDVFYRIDMQGTIPMVSPSIARYGYQAAELIGSNLRLLCVDPTDLEKMFVAVGERRPAQDLEITLRHKNGTPAVTLASARLLSDSQDRPAGAEGILRDITERKRAEAEIHTLNAELEQRVLERTAELEAANRELEAFSYSVSHDLRAPLRAINGFSCMLLEEATAQLPPESQRYLKLVRDNAQRMSHLVDDLLRFSRLTRQSLDKQPVWPANLVRQCLDELSTEREGQRVETRVGDLPLCQADPALLKQVFANLLSNALKYTQHREVALLEIGCRQENGERVFFVKDNGVGFDMRYANKLFGVFQRLHRAEGYEGTGVGLAIVQRIIHRHGGRVWVEAEVNQGATFYFTLEGGGAHD